jgi:predicted thioesterase
MTLTPGLIGEIEIVVDEKELASTYGGETLPAVLSTPRMIMYLERSCHLAVLPHLPEKHSTVGILVNIRHLASTPQGMKVNFRGELLETDRRRLRFKVEAWDELDKIAEGEHERFIIDWEKYNANLQEKIRKMENR